MPIILNEIYLRNTYDIICFMFGYIAPLKSELKIREFEVYNAYYCAICRTVKRRYGEPPRLMLTYDAVLVAMLADALNYGKQDSVLVNDNAQFKTFRCFNNPFKKRNEAAVSEGIEYAADIMVLLGCLSLKDKKADRDGGSLLKNIGISVSEAALRRAGRKAENRLGGKAGAIRECVDEQRALEAQKTGSLDRAADPTGKLMSAVLDFTGMPELGYHLGRYIYIIDSIDDVEKDRAQGSYNPLLLCPETGENLKAAIALDLAKVGDIIEGLTLSRHKGIIENIIYLGLHARADEVLKIKPEEGEGS